MKKKKIFATFALLAGIKVHVPLVPFVSDCKN